MVYNFFNMQKESKEKQRIKTEYKTAKKKVEKFIENNKDGAVLLVSGDFGIGKSTLIEDLELHKKSCKEIKIMDVDWDINGSIENLERINATEVTRNEKIKKTKSDDVEKVIKRQKNIKITKKILFFIAPIVTSILALNDKEDLKFFWIPMGISLFIFLVLIIILSVLLYKNKIKKKTQMKKIIVIENLDRMEWESIRNVLSKIHHLSRIRKKVFLVTYSTNNISSKFRLKYGESAIGIMPTLEIEKYIDKEININNYAKDKCNKISEKIIENQMKDKEDFKKNHPSAYEKIIEFCQKTEMVNFRAYKNAVIELSENITSINKININPAVIFGLLVLKYFDPEFSLKIQKKEFIIYDDWYQHMPLTSIKIRDMGDEWEKKAKSRNKKITEKITDTSKNIIEEIKFYSNQKDTYETEENRNYINHKIIDQSIFFLSDLYEKYAKYLSGNLENNFINYPWYEDEYKKFLILKMINNKEEPKNLIFLIQFLISQYWGLEEKKWDEILKRYSKLINKDLKIWQANWIIYSLGKILSQSVRNWNDKNSQDFLNMDGAWYIEEIKKAIDGKMTKLKSKFKTIFSLAEKTISNIKLNFDKKIILKEFEEEWIKNKFKERFYFNAQRYLLTCREDDIPYILGQLINLHNVKEIYINLLCFLRTSENFEKLKKEIRNKNIYIIFDGYDYSTMEKITKNIQEFVFDKDIKSVKTKNEWENREKTIEILKNWKK